MIAIEKVSSKVLAVVALILPVALTGCDERGMTITRTAQSPLVIERTADVPVYATQCHTYMVYGRHPSCGYHTYCRPSSTPGKPPVCTSRMRSCYHPQTRCTDYLSHHVRATLRIRFDERAMLLPGETEAIDLGFSGRYARKTLNMNIKSARYVYDYPRHKVVNLHGTQHQYVDVNVRVNKIKAVRPPNNVNVVRAEYVDGETLRVTFEDPYRFVRDIRESTFRFQVKRGLNTYADAEFRSIDLAHQQGPYVVEIRKGSPEWKRDPRRGKTHKLLWSVERDSVLFKDRFSSKENMSVRF